MKHIYNQHGTLSVQHGTHFYPTWNSFLSSVKHFSFPTWNYFMCNMEPFYVHHGTILCPPWNHFICNMEPFYLQHGTNFMFIMFPFSFYYTIISAKVRRKRSFSFFFVFSLFLMNLPVHFY